MMGDQLDFLEHKTQDTSIQALKSQREFLNGNRLIIYNLLKKCAYPVTNSEIGYKLGWTINRVTPRVNEMVKANIVEKCEKRRCRVIKSYVIVNTWYLKGRSPKRIYNPPPIIPRTTNAEIKDFKDLVKELDA